MDQSELEHNQPDQDQSLGPTSIENDPAAMPVLLPTPTTPPVPSQMCASCGGPIGADAGLRTVPTFVYGIGTLEVRSPRPEWEKEFAQAVGRAETVNLTDRQAAQKVLSQRENRYLARQACWVMTIEGLDTYVLIPRDPTDLDLLIEALRPTPSPLDLDCVIGILGGIAPAEMCNGLMVPIVAFDQLYSFDRDELIGSIPRPEGVSAEEFRPAAAEIFDRIMRMTDNAGATDEHRALNYCALRYPAIYETAAAAFARNASLSAVDVQLSPLTGTRKIVDVIFSYTNRTTDVTEKHSLSVDVTGEFPYLTRKLSPYYDI